ncbi:choice-of-anchor D domain-containing protein, partial [candidate division NPL-UPA2 bacterium]|nr:choice-of-anchor D domain-containing protein [candidate division NPL-UPA2 bacterium]
MKGKVIGLTGLFLMMAMTLFSPPAQGDWSVPLETTLDGNVVETLEWGMKEGATDGIDGGIDLPLPPLPPGQVHDVYFYYPQGDPGFQRLQKDYRGISDEAIWKLVMVIPGGSTMAVSWDPATLPPGYITTGQEADANWMGVGDEHNLREGPSQIEVSNPAADPLTKRYLIKAIKEVPLWSISGTVSYPGDLTGTVYVAAFDNPDFVGEPVNFITIPSPGSYTIPDLPDGAYHVGAFMDVDGDGEPSPGEPKGLHAHNPVTVSGGNVSNVDIALIVEVPEEPILEVTPTSLDFGEVIVNGSSDLDFTVTNDGTGTLTGNASVAAPFSIYGESAFSLEAGEDAQITVRFSPVDTGTVTDTVSFTSNGGNFDGGVSGVGVQPLLSVTPASLDFGNVIAGSSLYLAFTVTNDGTGTLEGEADVAAPFSIVWGSDFSLEEGASTLVLVKFSPIAVGFVRDTVAFTSNGGNPTGDVSGTGVVIGEPALSVDPPASLDFGGVTVGESRVFTFTVTNTGGGTLTGNASVAAPFSIYGESAFSLEAGEDAQITVRFSPVDTGTVTDTVSFTSNGGNFDGGVSGTGMAAGLPALSVTPAFFDFEEVTVGQFKDFTFTVTNTGGGTLTGRATVSGSFSIVGESAFNLGAGASAPITVRFNPIADGPIGEVVTFIIGSNLNRGVIGTG